MKLLSLISISLFSGICAAQHGGVQLHVLDEKTHCRYENVQLIASQDSIVYDTLITDDKAKVQFLELPVGKVNFSVREFGVEIAQFTLTVQLYQLLTTTVYIREKGQTGNLYFGNQGTPVAGNGQPENQFLIDRSDLQNYSKTELNEVIIACYRIPLIDLNSMSGCVVYKNDVSSTAMNSQSNLIEPYMGGITHPASGLNFRGSRSDAVNYYIDGVKVIGSPTIPHSAMNQITVYTGGIPANYGDVTGGIISIETKSARSYAAERNSRENAISYSIETPYYEEPEPILQRDQFLPIYENMFLSPLEVPHSTFGIDVDRASWNFIQSQLAANRSIPNDAVKLEEMVNSFDYSLPEVPAEKPMAVTFERMNCPWNAENQLVAIHLRAKDFPVIEKRPPHNLVFLVDVSGSMMDVNKLELLQKGLISLVETLNADDRVSLVTYAGNTGIVLQPTYCSEKETIIDAIQRLTAGGSTNGMGGIQMAYQLATEQFLPAGNNRIILATDGDFNVGINNPHELENYISLQRGKGIYLTALGFGMGNYRNDVLETLADRGDGNHFYINNLEECKEVLETRMGNLVNLARDVKLNVEFNPKLVANYRLIGYENRLMPSRDFNDDAKDGGEMGYGHVVTAVYEIEPGKAEESLDAHFSKIKPTGGQKELCNVRLRYKLLEEATSEEENYVLANEREMTENSLLQTIIAFGLLLRQSAFKGMCSEELLREMVGKLQNSKQELELKTAIKSFLDTRL
jgi:Ca-activated chloride channel family protein